MRAIPESLRNVLAIATALVSNAGASALAQDAGVQREFMRRRQATDAFEPQRGQQQETLSAPPESRNAVEARRLSECQRLENLSSDQLRAVPRADRRSPDQAGAEVGTDRLAAGRHPA